MKQEKFVYRYEIKYSSSENWGVETGVILKKFKVVRETDCFYIININEHSYKSEKFKKVSKDAKVSFAYTNKERAMKNFKKRTEKRIGYLEFFKEECEKSLEIVNRKDFKI